MKTATACGGSRGSNTQTRCGPSPYLATVNAAPLSPVAPLPQPATTSGSSRSARFMRRVRRALRAAVVAAASTRDEHRLATVPLSVNPLLHVLALSHRGRRALRGAPPGTMAPVGIEHAC